jgi:hypothetical protein
MKVKAFLPCLFSLCVLLLPVPAAFSADEPDLSNLESWEMVSVEGGRATRVIENEGKSGKDSLAIKITEVGGELLWHNQLKFVLPLEQSKRYRLRFRMKMEGANAPVQVGVSMNEAPYTSLADAQKIEPGEKWDEFDYEFSPNADEPNARISFHLNVPEATISISDVKLTSK